jgi:hypothetical protein
VFFTLTVVVGLYMEWYSDCNTSVESSNNNFANMNIFYLYKIETTTIGEYDKRCIRYKDMYDKVQVSVISLYPWSDFFDRRAWDNHSFVLEDINSYI